MGNRAGAFRFRHISMARPLLANPDLPRSAGGGALLTHPVRTANPMHVRRRFFLSGVTKPLRFTDFDEMGDQIPPLVVTIQQPRNTKLCRLGGDLDFRGNPSSRYG